MKKLVILLLAILVLVCLASCEYFISQTEQTTQPPEHEHTFEYVQHEETHFKQYTCGCPSPDIAEEHYDNDGDYRCDMCLFFMKKRVSGLVMGTYYLPYNTIYDPISLTFKENGIVTIRFAKDDLGIYFQQYWIEGNKVYMDIDTAPKVHVFTVYENALVFDPTLSTANLWDSMYYQQGAVVYFLPGVSESEMLATITMAKQKLDYIPNIEKIYGKYEYKQNHGKHGILENDVYAFMIEGDGKGEVWSDKILGTDYTFTYQDSREILIYCQGMLVSLNQALYRGFITPEILDYLNISHHDCKIAHSYDEGVITKNSDGIEEILYTCFICQNTKTVALPEDFSFTLTAGFDLYYDSSTGYLRNGYNYDLKTWCETTLILDHDELMNIYRIFYNGNMFDIKEDFDASHIWGSPSYEIEMSYTVNGETTKFTVWGSSFVSYVEWLEHSDFGYAHKKVVNDYIYSSEEYKSLPPNQNVYY